MSGPTAGVRVAAGARMAAEIAEQPAALERTLRDLAGPAARVTALAAGRGHLRFVGRGTSDNACVYGRYLAEARAGIPAALAAPSVTTAYDAALPLGDTVVVSGAASRSFEEKKVRHLGRLMGRIPFEPDIDAALANSLIGIAERLTWRQYVLLAVIGQGDSRLPPGEMMTDVHSWTAWGVNHDLTNSATTGTSPARKYTRTG